MHKVLLVDDNRMNLEILRLMISKLFALKQPTDHSPVQAFSQNKSECPVEAHYAQGYAIDMAVDGNEAVEALKRIQYDIVLMDCEMPVMDGYETTRLIRNPASTVLNHDIPIVAVTANDSVHELEKCLDAGMDSYICKPVNFNQLQVLFSELLYR